jgi:hypothetical protein
MGRTGTIIESDSRLKTMRRRIAYTDSRRNSRLGDEH